ncbi:MAG: hypothetical protein AAGD92_15610 [Pseudomonadota bacterium]
MNNLIRTATAGVAALGVAGVGYVGFTISDGDDAPVALAENEAVEICLDADIAFFPGDQSGCFSKSEIAAWRSRELSDPGRGKLKLAMTHPTDGSMAPKELSTCRDFIEMRYDGWYAMTSRDMRREAFFVRACGVIELLMQAKPAEIDHFAANSLTENEIATIGAEKLLRLGDDPAVSPGDPEIERLSTTSWRVAAGGQTLLIEEIAALDFDADTKAEILAFFAAGPDQASASVTEIVLLERDEPEAAIEVTVPDLSKTAISPKS